MVPALSAVTVSAVKPVPDKVKLVDEVRETLTKYDRKNAQILDQFYTDHPQFAIHDSSKMMPLFMFKYMIKYRHTLHSLTPLMDDYKREALAQSRTGSMVAALSPAMLFSEAADELSGHSQTQFLLYQQYADAVNLSWNNYFTPLSLANRYLTANEFKSLPAPTYQTGLNNSKVIAISLVLLAWVALTAVWAEQKIKQYKLMV